MVDFIDFSGYSGFIEYLFHAPNDIVGGILGILILIIVFSISFGSIIGVYDGTKAFLTAGFLTWGTAVFLTAFGILGSAGFVGTTLIFLLGLMFIDK